ncbi:hypothetical protein QCA50_011128 [Cerrena zonata]|uniref:Uncharacterized protein n=1 Tax=Cerrena zonata TaxID=2478898 RepID=A0AAW0G7N7_9APHY
MPSSLLHRHPDSSIHAAQLCLILLHNSKRAFVILMNSSRIVCVVSCSSVYVYSILSERGKDLSRYRIEPIANGSYEIYYPGHPFVSIRNSDNPVRGNNILSVCRSLHLTIRSYGAVFSSFSLLPSSHDLFVRQPTRCDDLSVIHETKHTAVLDLWGSWTWAAHYVLKCEIASCGSSLTNPEMPLLDIEQPKCPGYSRLSDKEIYDTVCSHRGGL